MRFNFLFCCLLANLSWFQRVNALELGTSAAYLTQGGEKVVPAVHSWMQISNFVLLGITNSGIKNNSFAQQTAIAHASYLTSFPRQKSLQTHIGIGGILTRTAVEQLADPEASKTSWSKAAGLAMGVHWRPMLSKSIALRVSWNGLYIPAGWAVSYLVFGHAQSASLGIGWNF